MPCSLLSDNANASSSSAMLVANGKRASGRGAPGRGSWRPPRGVRRGYRRYQGGHDGMQNRLGDRGRDGSSLMARPAPRKDPSVHC